MKTLVFYGSARKNGHTKQMLSLFLNHLEGKAEIVDCYREKNISPCMDCRYCLKTRGCAIKDDMQEIYKKIDAADLIVLAAPMYFHCIPGPMKSVLDRCQLYWAGLVRKDHDLDKPKIGVILMVGGAPDFEKQFTAGEMVLKGLLSDLNAEHMGTVSMPNSDHDSLEIRLDIAEQIIQLAKAIRERDAL